MCHEMTRERIIAGRHVVLNDLVVGSAAEKGRTRHPLAKLRRGDGGRTVLKVVNIAIHLAFAPVILNSANCKPSLMTAGWMSPLVMAGGFGVPKWENMRKPRGVSSSWALGCRASLGSPFPGFVVGSFPDFLGGAAEGGAVPLPLTLGFCLWEGAGLEEAGCPATALAAAFAARCASCCSRRSAFVICFWDFGGVEAEGLGSDGGCDGEDMSLGGNSDGADVSLKVVMGIAIVSVVVDMVRWRMSKLCHLEYLVR